MNSEQRAWAGAKASDSIEDLSKSTHSLTNARLKMSRLIFRVLFWKQRAHPRSSIGRLCIFSSHYVAVGHHKIYSLNLPPHWCSSLRFSCMCMSVFPACVFVDHMFAWCWWRPEETIGSPINWSNRQLWAVTRVMEVPVLWKTSRCL